MLTVNPNTYQIDMHAGTDETIRFTITDSTGATVDCTGATFKFTVKQAFSDADPGVLQKNETQMVLTQASLGIIDVPLVPADTSALAGRYNYDLQMTLSGLRRTVRQGIFNLLKRITQSA